MGCAASEGLGYSASRWPHQCRSSRSRHGRHALDAPRRWMCSCSRFSWGLQTTGSPHPRLPHRLIGHAWRDRRRRHPLGDGWRRLHQCARCSQCLAHRVLAPFSWCRHGVVGPQIPGGIPLLGPAPGVHPVLVEAQSLCAMALALCRVGLIGLVGAPTEWASQLDAPVGLGVCGMDHPAGTRLA